jgi:hypothetical protein
MFSVIFENVEGIIAAECDEVVVLAPENLFGINLDSSNERLIFPTVEGKRVATSDTQNWTSEDLIGAEFRLE